MSLSYIAKNIKRNGDDWLSFVQEETHRIASSSNSRYKLSKFSIGWDKANISTEDIPKWLKIFKIKGGWNTIKEVTQKAEVSLVSPETVFRSSAQRRHSAAHNPLSDSLLPDLIQFTNDAKAIALAFDVLLIQSLVKIINSNELLNNRIEKIDSSNIEFRFIIKSGNYWKEYKNTDKRALRKSSELNFAIKEAKKKAKVKNEIILIKSESNSIIDWLYT